MISRVCDSFSALQRAEIAEIHRPYLLEALPADVSVLFNEPKLLKLGLLNLRKTCTFSFSALQRAEIAEIGFHLV